MRNEHHAFVDGEAGRCGAILRHVGPGELRTRTVFRMGEGAPVYLVDHAVRHDGDVRRWTRFSWDSPTSDGRHSGTRHADGTVLVDGLQAPALTDAMGAYSEHLAVAELLRAEADVISFRQFDEGEPDQGSRPAELRKQGSEVIDLLDGSTVEADRVQLVVAGRPTNAHWCVEGVVVKSDWCGAESFLVDDLGALCAGLDPEVAARITEFTAQPATGSAG